MANRSGSLLLSIIVRSPLLHGVFDLVQKTVVFVSVQKEELCTCTIRTISSMQDALLLH